MNAELRHHLSADSIDEVLIGEGSPAAWAHLEKCAACRARVDEFRSAVGFFNQASAAWAESRPIARNAARQPSIAWFGRRAIAVWAAAALLLATAGVGFWRHTAPVPASEPVIASIPQDAQNQIAEDNELMEAVNDAIASNDRAVVDQYGLLTDLNSQHPRRAE